MPPQSQPSASTEARSGAAHAAAHDAPDHDVSGIRTVELVHEGGPVRTIAIANTLSLGICLRAALGGDAIAVMSASNTVGLSAGLDALSPSVVVIDGSDLPTKLTVGDIVSALAGAPPNVLRVIWGTAEDEAGPLIEALKTSGQPFVPVDRKEGPEPLLDIFRSRRSG